MAELKGTNVAAGIVPFTSEDKYATHDAQYGKGGFRSVATIAERDAISAERKTEGMIVRVTANGLNYEWKNNAWVEWLPKGNVTVDTALSTTSNNAIANKAATAGINEAKAAAAAAKTVADAAIPKANIVDDLTLDDALSSTKVPSTKAVIDQIDDTTASTMEQVEQARSLANAAIPKANISQDIEGASTRPDLVPSTKAVHDAIDGKIAGIPKPVVDAALSTTSTNAVQNKVVTAKINSVESRVAGNETDITELQGSVGDLNAEITTNHNAITDINSKLTPIKSAWDKKNAANGIVVLDSAAKLPASVLPAGYDNIDMVVAFVPANPTTGMTIGQKWYNRTTKKIFTATSATSGSETPPEGNEKVYINIETNTSYRWTGSDMVAVGDGSGVALGTTSSTAFPGDKGNTLYTNFGSGENLSGTQKARDFFGSNAADTYIKSIGSVTHSAERVEFGYQQNKYKDLSFANNNGITIQAANSNKAGVMTAAMYQTLQELEAAAFPLVVNASISGGSVYEVGASTRNPINITVTRKGVDITSGQIVTVSGAVGAMTTNGKSWTPANPVTANTTITVKAKQGTLTKQVNVSYQFKYKKYWGVSDKATLTNAEILALAGSGWADARTMGATRFDCTGGKYPYYIIPADKYTGLEVWVGGLKNTDLVVTDVNLVNASGATKAYKVIRLANKQTGVLSIEFK